MISPIILILAILQTIQTLQYTKAEAMRNRFQDLVNKILTAIFWTIFYYAMLLKK